MKIRWLSILLAAAYFVWGILAFLILRNFTGIFSDFAVPLPLVARLEFAGGPGVVLALAWAACATLVFVELKHRRRGARLLFAAILLLWMMCTVDPFFLLLRNGMIPFRGTYEIH